MSKKKFRWVAWFEEPLLFYTKKETLQEIKRKKTRNTIKPGIKGMVTKISMKQETNKSDPYLVIYKRN